MKNYINIIKQLVKEIKRIEIIYYKVACDNFTLYNEVLFYKVSDGKLRMEKHRKDSGYFKKVKNILDENISNPKKALKILKKIEEPKGALKYYGDINYINIIQDITKQVIELNNTLDKEEQLKEVADLEQEIKNIQAKRYISPKELSQLLPNMSISQQQTYRGRLKNKIPYHQATSRGGVTYIVEDVKEWMENNNIR